MHFKWVLWPANHIKYWRHRAPLNSELRERARAQLAIISRTDLHIDIDWACLAGGCGLVLTQAGQITCLRSSSRVNITASSLPSPPFPCPRGPGPGVCAHISLLRLLAECRPSQPFQCSDFLGRVLAGIINNSGQKSKFIFLRRSFMKFTSPAGPGWPSNNKDKLRERLQVTIFLRYWRRMTGQFSLC